jgi:hypothetical protein
MSEEVKIPPKSEWAALSINQLYEVKVNITNKYYAMKDINASFASQYLVFIRDIEGFIVRRENEKTDE